MRVCPKCKERQKQLENWLREFDDFLVQWLWNDFPGVESKWFDGEAFWTVDYSPSDELDFLLGLREKLLEASP